jgi:hypothetical protein
MKSIGPGFAPQPRQPLFLKKNYYCLNLAHMPHFAFVFRHESRDATQHLNSESQNADSSNAAQVFHHLQSYVQGYQISVQHFPKTWENVPKDRKMYQMVIKYSKWP